MKYIDAEKFIAGLKHLQDKFPVATYDAIYHLITSLQQEMELPEKYQTPDWLFEEQEQQEVDFEKEYQEFCKDFPFPWEYMNKEYIDVLCLSVARHFYGLRNRALDEAARHVYESWMGGTMDDVRRDMVELGKVLNAGKEK